MEFDFCMPDLKVDTKAKMQFYKPFLLYKASSAYERYLSRDGENFDPLLKRIARFSSLNSCVCVQVNDQNVIS